MFIQEVSKQTKLTKKAIEYYVEQGLISPTLQDNGYRDFSPQAVEALHKIAVLRKLGLSIPDIAAVLSDTGSSALHKIATQQTLAAQKEAQYRNILGSLSGGTGYAAIVRQLQSLEQTFSIAQRLLNAFPGYYGRFVCLHFARFLQEPMTTAEQQTAYDTIVAFLDNLPPLVLPPDLQAYMEEYTQVFTAQAINTAQETMRQSLADIDSFMTENKELLEDYLAFKQSDAYKNHPAARLQQYLQEFQNNSGYTDLFIPAMQRLSPAYAQYYRELEQANAKFLRQYPQAAPQ